MKILRFIILFCALISASSGRAETLGEIENPRVARREWVSDGARVIDAAREKRLNRTLAILQKKTSAEMAIVTIRKTDGNTPKNFATRLFNRWGIGKRGRNNGVLMLVVMEARRIEIETGSGLARILPDDYVQTVLQRYAIPRFRDDDYGGGIEAGTNALAAHLQKPASTQNAILKAMRNSPCDDAKLSGDGCGESATGKATGVASRHDTPVRNPAPSFAVPEYSTTPRPSSFPAGGAALLGLGGLVSLGGIVFLATRPRRCKRCNQPMQRISETDDDALLAWDQQFEESLGSVDYVVWRCAACENIEIDRKVRWTSSYGECPQCRHQSLHINSQVERAATYDHSGLATDLHRCEFPRCGYSRVEQRIIPQRERPAPSSAGAATHFSSSSSSSSSSHSSSPSASSGNDCSSGSFGGGSSSGGGAGASW